MPVSDKIADYLLDRPRFKFYAAAEHLNRLKSLHERHETIVAPKAHISAEMEIDCFLTQLTGAVEAVLFLINERLDLGLALNQVNFEEVQSALSSKTKKFDLLLELEEARQYGNWYWQLTELRNHSMQESLLQKDLEVRSHPARAFLRDPRNRAKSVPMDLEVIEYLERSLAKVETMIDKIRSTDPVFA